MFEDNLRRRSLYPAELLVHMLIYFTQIFLVCQENTALFLLPGAYTVRQRFARIRKGGGAMNNCGGPRVDLDDLIFEKDAGGPSER